jgi:hypothetical protein
MIFFFKQKEIIVDCFTPHDRIYEYYRPMPAAAFIPEEWKLLPKTIETRVSEYSNATVPRATLKKCKGFTNLFSSGFILQLWTDILFDTNPQDMIKMSPVNFIFFSEHPAFQKWEELYKGYKHVKISSPWQLQEKSGVRFTWNRCDWHNTDNADKMHIISAVTDFKYQSGTQINMFIKDKSVVKLTAGQPMVHLIPMSDKKVKLKYHLISHQEFDQRFSYTPKFTGQYKETKRVLDNKNKCPFGFGK